MNVQEKLNEIFRELWREFYGIILKKLWEHLKKMLVNFQ